MKSSIKFITLPLVLPALANPFPNSNNGLGLIKRAGNAPPSGCSAPTNDYWVGSLKDGSNKKKCTGSSIAIAVVGDYLTCTFPTNPQGQGNSYSEKYLLAHLNIGSSQPTSSDYTKFNFNQDCTVAADQNSASCKVKLTDIAATVCGTTWFISAHSSHVSGNDGWGYGPCIYGSCTSDWAMWWKFSFDCTGQGPQTIYTTTTSFITRTGVTTKPPTTAIVTKTVTTTAPATTKVVTTTTTKVTGGKTSTVTQATTVTQTATVATTVTTTTTTAPASTVTVLTTTTTTTTAPSVTTILPSACQASTGWLNSGVTLVTGLVSSLTNLLFTCTTVQLLTGTYGILTVKDAQGNVINVGNVLLKLENNGLYVGVDVNAGWNLVSVGVFGSCPLQILSGLTLSTCSSFNLCQILPSLSPTSGVANLCAGNVLGPAPSTNLLGQLVQFPLCAISLTDYSVQAVVQKLVLPGTSC